MKVSYSLAGDSQRFVAVGALNTDLRDCAPWEREEILEYVAEDFHDEHDGWESRWPLTFVVYGEMGAEAFRGEVNMGARPTFSARLQA